MLSTGDVLVELTSARDQFNDALESIAQWRANAGNEILAVMGGNQDGHNLAYSSALSVLNDETHSRQMAVQRVFTDRVARIYRAAP